MKAAAIAVGLCALVAGADLARAETRRVAVVVGNNAGGQARAALSYAESDAGKFADFVIDLGGVGKDDLFLIQGGNRRAIVDAMAHASERVRALHDDPSSRVILLFYYSGHGDGRALLPGDDSLSYEDLRAWLAASGTDVSVTIVDACQSGGLGTKGGTPGPSFQIRMIDDLNASGEALISSSAIDEVALESAEIGGSYFTHHLLSGLRGAADRSGDHRVTLAEAYQYAYAQTVLATGSTIVGAQHPTYDYDLSGQGELVLAELDQVSASVELPEDFERGLVVDVRADQIVAELLAGTVRTVAVRAGTIGIRAWRDGKAYTGRFVVAEHEHRSVAWSELTLAHTQGTVSKGRLLDAEPRTPGLRVGLALGMRQAVADPLPAALGVRIGVAAPALRAAAHLDLVSASDAGFRERSAIVWAGPRVGVRRGVLEAAIGADLGVGGVWQDGLDQDGGSPLFAAQPVVELGVALGARLRMTMEGGYGVSLMKRDEAWRFERVPSAWLGLAWTPE